MKISVQPFFGALACLKWRRSILRYIRKRLRDLGDSTDYPNADISIFVEDKRHLGIDLSNKFDVSALDLQYLCRR